MYESILKTATGDPDFRFVLRSSPLPPTPYKRTFKNDYEVICVVLCTAIAYSMSIMGLISPHVAERSSGLIHFQSISGMKIAAYWTANYIFDGMKLLPITIASLACFFSLNLNI
jgi:hypothetical protein